MASVVYYGSPRQARWDANETLPAKLDLIIDRLNLRERVKGETVAVKLHLGNNLGYSTLHPLFVRRLVQVIKDGGGRPFLTDLDWDVRGSESRGYTSEVIGCPIYPASGLNDQYQYTFQRPYKHMTEWGMVGMVHDASFLVNFAHVKGHPSCGYGGAIKNLALGCMITKTRRAMHDVNHFEPYWFPELCPDAETRQRIIDSCPHGALVQDKSNPDGLHMHYEPCNQCLRCMQVAPKGSLVIRPANFHAFMEACAISTSITMSTFEAGKAVHLAMANQITPLCDCFGFTSMPILPDAGVFGSDDIVALEQAVLDVTGKSRLQEENVPTTMEVHCHEGHPLAQLHGPYKDPYKVTEFAEGLGLGSRQYELVDVFPVEAFARPSIGYISAE